MAERVEAVVEAPQSVGAERGGAGVEPMHGAAAAAAHELGGTAQGATAGEGDGLAGPPLASQVDPRTGLSMGEVRCIDCFAQDVEALLVPWQAVRATGELRFNADKLGRCVLRFVDTFPQVHPEQRSLGQAPKAFEHLKQALSRDSIRPLLAEVLAALNPDQSVFLAGTLGDWLGLTAGGDHRYTLRVIVNAEGGASKKILAAQAVITIATLTYSSDVLPGWTRTLLCSQLSGGLGVNPLPLPVAASVSHPLTPAEAVSHVYIPPSALDRAEAMSAVAEAAALGARREASVLEVATDHGDLVFDTSGWSTVVGTGQIPEVSAMVGAGRCAGIGAAEVSMPEERAVLDDVSNR